MNSRELQEALDKVVIVWSCFPGRDQHTIGCPHKEWSVKELQSALETKMRFEQSGLRGTPITG